MTLKFRQGQPSTPVSPVSIVAADGYALTGRLYHASNTPRATVVIHGATAVPQRYYARFAEYLAQAGLHVLTYDYRGVGESRPPSLAGFSATLSDWVQDARAALRMAQREPLPVIWIGHSFGGQLLGLLEEAKEVQGVILVASQLGYVGDWPLALQPRVRLFWHVLIPLLTKTLGYYPGRLGLGEDLPRGVAQDWRRWALTKGYYLAEHPEAEPRLRQFPRPLLFYSFTDDTYAPRKAVAALLDKFDRAQTIHRRVAPWDLAAQEIGHFGFFRKAFVDSLWAEALWFVGHLLEGTPLPPALLGQSPFSHEALDSFFYDREARVQWAAGGTS